LPIADLVPVIRLENWQSAIGNQMTELMTEDLGEREMATQKKEIKQPKPLPAPNSDFYDFRSTFSAEEQEILKQVREFLDTKVAPIIGKYWLEDAFPFELLPALKELNIGGIGIEV
jgi:alkylation response protein AidB-like acyl-CoA dehydrogenase